MWAWALITCFLAGAYAASVGDACTMTDGSPGECKRVKDCPVLLRQLRKNPLPVEDREMVLALMNECPTEPYGALRNSMVCCNKLDGREWKNDPTCGIVFASKVVEGVKTNVGEFPWMALLGYEIESRIEFKCAGTLINSRWVLTAAHCISCNLRTVRLGEHDLTVSPDCQKLRRGAFCFPHPEDVAVLRAVRHPAYRRRKYANDIALVELERPVTYREEILPICLPVGEASKLNVDGLKMTVAGWGRAKDTEAQGSQVLMKLVVPVVTNAQCKAAYKSRSEDSDFFSRREMCAGGEPRQDSCSGDSGGPLVMDTPLNGRMHWTQFGVVSFGPTNCGTPGIPVVYTRVSKYLAWIANTVDAWTSGLSTIEMPFVLRKNQSYKYLCIDDHPAKRDVSGRLIAWQL